MTKIFSALGISLLLFSCNSPEETSVAAVNTVIEDSTMQHPDWSQNSTIYELNIRQFSEEGTFKAIVPQLDRLKKLGVDIIWLMPVQPIGELNRKGTMGSYYSVQDYLTVNPEFGTEEEFQNLVDEIHNRDMKIIIDWVANHSAWDNKWATEHPDWYQHNDSTGEFVSPYDWTDVIAFNYDNPNMRKGMTDALVHWVKDFNIDGFRCDVAYLVPTDFWDSTRAELDAVKPVFMLAEAEKAELQEKAFDMGYGWEFHHVTNAVSKGEKDVNAFDEVLNKMYNDFPEGTYYMMFITNHDENSWNGTIEERYGKNTEAMATVTFTVAGMPLIYSGQEANNTKRLEFFEKDAINWSDTSLYSFYSKLMHLNRTNQALWNGESGAKFNRISHENNRVYVFERVKGDNRVLVAANFSEHPVSVKFNTVESKEVYTNLMTDEATPLNGEDNFELPAHGYIVLYK